MGINGIYKQFRRRSGEKREDGTVGYSNEWIVTTTSVLDDAADVLKSPQLLQQFSSLPSDGQATLRNLRADQLDDPYVWTVRFEYDSKLDDTSTSQEENPINNPPKVRWSSTPIKIAAVKDIDGKAILNKAGDRYDPPLEVNLYLPTVTIERVEYSYSPAGALTYVGALNSDPFAGVGPRYAMLTVYDGTNFVHTDELGNQFIYWNVSYEIIFNPLGWDPEVLEQGYYELVDGDRRRMQDDDKQPLSEPFVLNEDGGKGNPDSPVFTKWKVTPEQAFSALGLAGIL